MSTESGKAMAELSMN